MEPTPDEDVERAGMLEKPDASKTSRWRWPFFLFSLVMICAFISYLGVVRDNQTRNTWPEQLRILEQMVLYQKVRLLKNLSSEEMQRHHVDVVSLPAFGPEFFDQQFLERNLGYSKKISDGSLEITRESSRDIFVRVSMCWCDVSLAALKMMAALLSLEASIHVCNLPAASSPSVKEWEQVWTGGNRRLGGGAEERRLAFNLPSSYVANKSVEDARMSCASQINGLLSSLLAVSQYVSDSQYSCPAPQNVKNKNQAKCSMGVSVAASGLEKTAAGLSDIAVECRDPTFGTIPYSKPVQPGREDILMAACLNNVGQATTYIAKFGYQLNDLATAPGVCPEYPTSTERYICMENIASLLVDIGQTVTYLSGAVAGCGQTTLVPFSCASRIAATITGLGDFIQGLGAGLAYCDYAGPIQRKIAGKVSDLEEKMHKKRYTHNIPLH